MLNAEAAQRQARFRVCVCVDRSGSDQIGSDRIWIGFNSKDSTVNILGFLPENSWQQLGISTDM